jgi:hypothetical protein
VIFLSQERLMLESEQAISEYAANGSPAVRRVCTQLLGDPTRYVHWHVGYEHRMGTVAVMRRRHRQVLALRALSLRQIHGSALVRYLRENHVIGPARVRTLRLFFGVADASNATLIAHRDYLLSATSQVCTTELLALANDVRGVQLLHDYEIVYGQFFGVFCAATCARQGDEPYLLGGLLPEVRLAAANLRRKILEGDPWHMARLRDLQPLGSLMAGLTTADVASRSAIHRKSAH